MIFRILAFSLLIAASSAQAKDALVPTFQGAEVIKCRATEVKAPYQELTVFIDVTALNGTSEESLAELKKTGMITGQGLIVVQNNATVSSAVLGLPGVRLGKSGTDKNFIQLDLGAAWLEISTNADSIVDFDYWGKFHCQNM